MGTGAEGSFLQGPLVAARRALVMETAVKSRRIMWSLSSLFELCILWYYCFCLLDFFVRFFYWKKCSWAVGFLSHLSLAQRLTTDAAAQLPAASASKRRQQQAKPVLVLARCAERSVLQQGWNVKCPVDMWSRRMAFANHKVPCMRDA